MNETEQPQPTPQRPRRGTHSHREVPPGAWPVNPAEPEVNVELTPGTTCKVRLPADVPRFALFGIVETEGGYKVAPAVWPQHIPLGRMTGKLLGLPIGYSTLRRLIIMGAVQASMPAPNAIYVDAASLLAHLRRTRIRPGKASWWTHERRLEWRAAEGDSIRSVTSEDEDEGQ